MSDGLDRAEIIELLERLGTEDDAEALAAARTLHARISSAGVPWDMLLVPDGPPEDAYEEEEEEEEEYEEESYDDEEDEEEYDDEEDEGEGEDEDEEEDDEPDGSAEAEEDPAERAPAAANGEDTVPTEAASAGDTGADAEADAAEEPAEAVASAAADEAESAVGERPANKDLQLIERLLKRPGLTDATREDLELMKEDIAEGSLSAMDRNYLKSLEKRLKG